MRLKRGKTRASTIADELRSRIINGTLLGGAKLAERELALEFGTSRIPVREALRTLESEGYIDVRPRSGTVVRPIDYEYTKSVVEVYRVLVPIVIRHSIPLYTDDLYKKAERIIEEMERSSEPLKTIEHLNTLRELLQSPAKHLYAYKVLNDIFMYNLRIIGSISNFVFSGAFHTDGYRSFLEHVRQGKMEEAIAEYVGMVESVLSWTEEAMEKERKIGGK